MRAETIHRSLLWRRLDPEGHEFFRLLSGPDGWSLAGTAVFAFDGTPCTLHYEILCDAEWRTRSVRVEGWAGTERVRREVSVDPSGRWRLDGVERPELDGCVDIDLEFSPCTNTLPIRRLGLSVSEASAVRTAWLRFPELGIELFEQVYTRLEARRYRFESGDGEFVRDLDVDADGLVLVYPDLWEAAATAGPTASCPAGRPG